MNATLILSVSETRDALNYNFLCSLPKPPCALIPSMPSGFFFITQCVENGENIVKLWQKN